MARAAAKSACFMPRSWRSVLRRAPAKMRLRVMTFSSSPPAEEDMEAWRRSRLAGGGGGGGVSPPPQDLLGGRAPSQVILSRKGRERRPTLQTITLQLCKFAFASAALNGQTAV